MNDANRFRNECKDTGCVVYASKIASKEYVATMKVVPWSETEGVFPLISPIKLK